MTPDEWDVKPSYPFFDLAPFSFPSEIRSSPIPCFELRSCDRVRPPPVRHACPFPKPPTRDADAACQVDSFSTPAAKSCGATMAYLL
jgi:hypothetical protein